MRCLCLAVAFAHLAACAADGGQTGSPAGGGGMSSGTGGSGDVCEEHDCTVDLERHVEHELGAEVGTGYAPSLVATRCFVLSTNVPGDDSPASLWGTACECDGGHGDAFQILDAPGPCAVRGHAGDCVMWHGDIEACDTEDPHSCDAACEELEDRFLQDSMRAKSFTVRAAQCHDSAFEGGHYPGCSGIVEIEGFCYPADPSVRWKGWQRCDLSDDEILSAPENPLPDCDAFPESVPQTSDCRLACDTAATCAHAEGCWYGPDGGGYGVSYRGICSGCHTDDDCLPGETCAHGICALPENVECREDRDCGGEVCIPEGISVTQEIRGNEQARTRCGPAE